MAPWFTALAFMLLAATAMLLPMLVVEWFPYRIARGRAVEHVTCANCLYNVEFAPARNCQECGGDLARIGILHPQHRSGRPLRMPLYFTLFAGIALAPAITLGFFIGWLANDIAVESQWRHEKRERYIPSIIASGPSSNGFLAIAAWLEYDHVSKRGEDGTLDFRGHEYHRLGLSLTSLNRVTLPRYVIELDGRPFRWVNGRYISPFDESPDEFEVIAGEEGPRYRLGKMVAAHQVLTDHDIDREAVFDWLRAGAVNVDDPAVRADVDAFLDHLFDQFTTAPLQTAVTLDDYQSVAVNLGYEWPGAKAERVSRYTTIALAWLLLLLVPLRRIRRTKDERRRLAREWLAAQCTALCGSAG